MDLALQVHPSKPDFKQSFDWASTADLGPSFTSAFAMVSAKIDFKALSSIGMFVPVLGILKVSARIEFKALPSIGMFVLVLEILAFVASKAYRVKKAP